MTPGLPIWKCKECGATYFPERLICLKCGQAEFETKLAHTGEIEDITVVTHVLGQENWTPKPIATVRLEDGQRIIAGAIGEISIGDTVSLQSDEVVPYVKRP